MDYDILTEVNEILANMKNREPEQPKGCQAPVGVKGVIVLYGCGDNHPECDVEVDMVEQQFENLVESKAAQLIAENKAAQFIYNQDITNRLKELEKENRELKEENEAYRKTVADLMKPAVDSAWRSFVKRFRVNE